MEQLADPIDYRPTGVDDLAPSGPKARAVANMAAIALLKDLDAANRQATPVEQKVLARWGSWGAVQDIFDTDKTNWSREREQLRDALDDREFAAASRTTINAHYTDPMFARSMWKLAADLGFDSGDVLEPGCGSGHFIGLAPDSARIVGVELDPVSAKVATHLYPSATIRTESFADSRIPDHTFDMAIGNVPFSNNSLTDSRHNAAGHSMHNHFLIKSVALTRPGGLVVALTSHYTLDAQNPAARRALHATADLIGAVRLPTGAHRRMAGTEVLTDVVVLRKRHEHETPGEDSWVTTTPKIIDGEKVRINNYFDANPHRVLGDLHVGTGMYGSTTLHVTQPEGSFLILDLETQLAEIASTARSKNLAMTARTSAPVDLRAVAEVGSGKWNGHIDALADGTFTVMTNGVPQPYPIPEVQGAEARALLGLRDQARALLEAEASRLADTTDLDTMRNRLHNSYTAYADKYGPINRFTLTVGSRINKETKEPVAVVTRRVPGVMTKLRPDPFFPLVIALEVFDDNEQSAQPATLLKQRVVVPREPKRGADTPEDALAICMDTVGRPELARIAHLLGVDEAEARDQLGELVFDEPVTGNIVPAAEYLSGNVRVKLDAAITAAVGDERFARNVAELKNVTPTPLGADEIEARLGAVWIPADDVRQFLVETLNDPSIKVEHPGGNVWEVRGHTKTARATAQWGTARVPAPRLAQHILEQRTPTVSDKTFEGKSIPNPTETVAAQEKATAIQERFSEWVWEDPERAARLSDEYNRRFNSIVLRDYAEDGKRLSLPGLADTITLREHQRTAVARMISEPAVLLAHAVGAGKTLEAAAGAMELKRLGLVNKPVIVVPNHMLAQVTREFLAAYPAAKLLAAGSKDLEKDKRRQFVAKSATHDWDAVIMTHGAFERIPLPPEQIKVYLERETESLREMLSNAKGSENGLTVKRIEKKLQAQEEKIKKALDGAKDVGVSFTDTGMDYVVADEAHTFKNLQTASNIITIEGSNRARDMHMKLDYLRSQHGARIATFMTATPIANSVAEAHIVQRFLRPDLLRDAGVEHFDRWAATFGTVVSDIEMDPTGTGFRQKTRFAKFQNVPELLRMWHTFTDVKTPEDLNLPIPLVAARSDGQRLPETVLVEPSADLLRFVQQLGERAEIVRSGGVDPTEDNMLKISSDGRKAALDMRLVHADIELDPYTLTKADVAAQKIASIWQVNRDNEYLDPATGEPSPVRGAAQMVFADLATPNNYKWDVYNELKNRLVEHGMPSAAIKFIHEARNDSEKAQLFAATRSGHVAVLIGSTAKMGTGTNAQTRLVASHHLDAPWRPADVEQQIGRSIRQGNQNPEVGIYRYITENSFDAYSWQTLERKAKFIAQITRGSLDVRDIEDVGDTALSFGEVKALASGDPLVLDKAKVDNELARLERLSRAYNRSVGSLHQQIDSHQHVVARADTDLPQLAAAVAKTVSTKGDAFAMTVNGQRTTERAEAGRLLAAWAGRTISPYTHRSEEYGPIAEIGGQIVEAGVRPGGMGVPPGVAFSIKDAPRTSFTVDLPDVRAGAIGPVLRIENRIHGLGDVVEHVEAQRDSAHTAIIECQEALDRPFKHGQALVETRQEAERINAAMTARAAPPQPPPGDDVSAAADQPTGPTPSPAQPSAGAAGPARRQDSVVAQAFPAVRPSLGASPTPEPQPGSGHSPTVKRHREGRSL